MALSQNKLLCVTEEHVFVIVFGQLWSSAAQRDNIYQPISQTKPLNCDHEFDSVTSRCLNVPQKV